MFLEENGILKWNEITDRHLVCYIAVGLKNQLHRCCLIKVVSMRFVVRPFVGHSFVGIWFVILIF